MDPDTNVVDAYKELGLLEDHLIKPDRYCPDCIRKHLLKVEGLADECVSLGGDGTCQSLALAAREWRARLMQGEELRSVARSVRQLRKEIGRKIPVHARVGVPTWGAIRKHKVLRWALPVAGGFLLARLLSRGRR